MLLPALAFLGRHGTRVLAVGIIVGLALPDLAHALKPFLPAMVAATMTGALLRLEWRDIGRQLRAWPRIAATTAWLIVATPVLVAVVAKALPLPDGLVAGMVLSAAGPCIMAAPSIALLLGLDAALSLVAMVAVHLLAPLTVPPLALALLGIHLHIGMVELTVRLAAFVLGAAIVAEAIRRVLGRERLRAAGEAINGANMLVLVAFAIAIMDGITAAALADPGLVLVYLFAALVFNALLQVAGARLFRRTGAPAALAVGFMTGNRNMGLMWAALGADTPIAIALYFAVAQLPMYLFPAVQSPLYRRWLAR
ncbi:MAG: Na+-dependent transporter [Alphaproteobacteria bacterium]|nr:Na+-dependent transporter [Alphaproteobacteria bacterium]